MISGLQEQLRMLEAAAAEVPSSEALRTLLGAVRDVGNWLNNGTARGGAGAFKLEVLLQLAQVTACA
jgi:hypothetical protein